MLLVASLPRGDWPARRRAGSRRVRALPQERTSEWDPGRPIAAHCPWESSLVPALGLASGRSDAPQMAVTVPLAWRVAFWGGVSAPALGPATVPGQGGPPTRRQLPKQRRRKGSATAEWPLSTTAATDSRRVRGLCTFKSLVAGRPPLSRVHPSREWRPVRVGSSSQLCPCP